MFSISLVEILEEADEESDDFVLLNLKVSVSHLGHGLLQLSYVHINLH